MTMNRLRLSLILFLFAASQSSSILAAPQSTPTQTGTAVYYSDRMNGRRVALKGEKYDKNALTAATHGTYPLGSMLRVTNISNGKSVTVKVNDRMSSRSEALIDLSRKAAEELDMIKSGHTRVKVELLQTRNK
jgi:rare lipoprotein A